jgi:hydrogenase/urease accessory protein HupE
MKRALAILIFCAAAAPVAAHELRPAYLELRETAAEIYHVLWKVPGLGDDLRLGLYAELPDGSVNLSAPRATMAHGAFIERWTITRPGGLTGGRIHIAGLSATMTDVLVRVEHLDGTTQVTRLTPAAPSVVVAATPSAWAVAGTYSALGIQHILSGVDHLLFVLALLIITGGGWQLVRTVTAFTVSHSITLSLATLGLLHVPQQPVETVIALSVAFVAAEIVQARSGRPGITTRAPWIVAFIFGLLHGLGFAGGLSDAGLPPSHIPTALLFFNLGVEIGHCLFIGSVVALIVIARRIRIPRPRWAALLPPYAIGTLAAFWVIQRTLAF